MSNTIEVFIFTQNRDAIIYRYAFYLLLGVIALCLGLYRAWRVKRRIDYGSERFTSVFFILWALGWGVISGSTLYSQIKDYSELYRIYYEGNYSVVEGNVVVLHEQPSGGHDRGDVIVVDGIEFEFSYFSETFGYNQTISHGGALTDGRPVRLIYCERPAAIGVGTDNLILRVQILESP